MKWLLRAVALVAVAAVSVYLAYELVIAPGRALQDRIHDQQETIARLELDKNRLETYVKILKRTERRARIEVLRQAPAEQGRRATTIRFTETDADGGPINISRDLTLPDQEVYIDTLVVKFEDHFIELEDPLKGHALMVFRRIFSSTMPAEAGFPIDPAGQVPEPYAEGEPGGEFEQEFWDRFWDLANDEELASAQGVRAIHGDAPYMRMEPGRVYEILLRSTGEVIIMPGSRLPGSELAQ